VSETATGRSVTEPTPGDTGSCLPSLYRRDQRPDTGVRQRPRDYGRLFHVL